MSQLIFPYKGTYPILAKTVWVAQTATIIGSVHIGESSSIWFNCVVRGDVNEIRIGTHTNIQDGTVIHVTGGGHGTYIGNGVTIGHCAVLHACTLESGSFVGMKACVMDGVVVEGGAMVAAGALVTPGKRIPTGQVWSGSPAKYMRDLTDAERAFIPVSAERYAKLASEYLRGMI
jgi:carbonic anhydrase/acetyltransferase-like protein (isoleucine patch superfamily)